jgi:hypothetical protein
VNVLRPIKEKKARKWLWFSLAALAALQVYYVREMLAALLLFTLIFSVALLVAIVFFLLDRGSQRAMDWVEPHALRAAQAARRLSQLLDFGRKPLQRPPSEAAH